MTTILKHRCVILLGVVLLIGLPFDGCVAAPSNAAIPGLGPSQPLGLEPPVQHRPGDPLPALTDEILVVLFVTVLALVLFATEIVPMDITAMLIMITLIVLEPWTGISAVEGISGFASPATITVLAMFILSEGIRRTGVIQRLGAKMVEWTGTSVRKQLATIIGFVVPSSGILNNTAVVAILFPMVIDISNKCRNSPSKLLIPLSYASMFGGMLTVIGTSTNLLASDLTARLLGRPIGLFEFTHLGLLVSLFGAAYLLTVGHYLLPARIRPEEDLTERFEMRGYLTEVVVPEDSPLVGNILREAIAETGLDVDVIQLIRHRDSFLQPIGQKTVQAGDILVVRTDRATLLELVNIEGLELLPEVDVTEEELEKAEEKQSLVEIVLAPGSSLVGETLESLTFRQRYDATVLALRHGNELIRTRMDRKELQVGDTLLIQASPDSIARLRTNRDFIVAQELHLPDQRTGKIPLALGIVGGVVALAATGVLPILVSALCGAFTMVLTGCLKPSEIYEAVHWDVIFLLAGVIPLGVALEKCGAADLIAGGLTNLRVVLPPLAVLGVLYLITALLTNVVSNNASVLLMIPVAIDTALRMGVDPFPFVLIVTFAASTAFMTPMGYQTNLFVHGPGGYRFTDYLRVGAPLQLLLAVVTTLGIAFFWPL